MSINNPGQEIVNQLIDLFKQEQYSDALEKVDECLEEFPTSEVLLNIKASVCKSMGNIELAEKYYLKSIELNPKYPKAYNNLGILLLENGNFEGAESLFMEAISIDENFHEAFNNLGNSLLMQRKFLAAENYFKRAISLNKNFIDPYINLGISYQKNNKIKDAEKVYIRALGIDSKNPKVHFNLGVLYDQTKEIPKAIQAYKNAFKLNNHYVVAKSKYIFLNRLICHFENQESNEINFNKDENASSDAIDPFSMLAIDKNPSSQLGRARKWSQVKYGNFNMGGFINGKRKNKKLRIAYLSADFKEHPVGYQIKKIIRLHDREKIEVFGYSFANNSPSEMYELFSKNFDKFTDLSTLNLNQALNIIRKDEIDIAIDLHGYTNNAWTEIFASRVAPIQINHVGYPGTMGSSFHDYIIADSFVIPKENQKYFSEKIIYMPDQYQPQDNDLKIPSNLFDRSKFNLPDKSFVFCAINNSYKISIEVFRVWIYLLSKIENSFLWCLESNSFMKENILNELEKFNIPKSRVIFSGRVSHEDYLAQFKLADLFLDTFDYNAGTTASNALYAGLPVITKSGSTFASRMAGSFLNSLDMQELITYSNEEYTELALKLAKDRKLLAGIKEKLLKNIKTKPLFNSEKYAKDFDEVLIKTYNTHS